MELTDRGKVLTEQRLAESMSLDTMSTIDAVKLMNAQAAVAVAAVEAQTQSIAQAVERVADALRSGGRLIYVGAGTSGRLGVLDASECPPTFGVDPSLVQGIIAGGPDAMFRSKEGVEDDADAGAAAVDASKVSRVDVVFGIAAGGSTPFVHGALRRAKTLGAKTIFLSCAQPAANEAEVDVVIRTLTGPEVLTGSTRLKAGTATKLVLNTVTTLAMVRLGKVYENLMVDLRASNTKLRDRAARIVGGIVGCDRVEAFRLLDAAGGSAKLAIVMGRLNVDRVEAEHALADRGGHLGSLIKSTGPDVTS